MQLCIATEEEEEEGLSSTIGTVRRGDSFSLSQSGTFSLQDFSVNRRGISEREPGSSNSPLPGSQRLSRSKPTPRHDGHVGDFLDVSQLDELEMLEELGSGASGTVRKAKHRPTGKLVAVKQIQILEKAKRDQMVSELRIMRTHQCPFLVSLYNAFYEEAQVYMVLEYMDAGSVASMILRNPSGVKDEVVLAKIGLQMLNGLNYLHRQHHQVHRDLKPANVMINKRGQVKISDFGISSQLDSTQAFCQTFVGTACYMAPERLSGAAYSYSADIWSFGLILLELSLGRYPYPSADNYFKLLASIQDDQAPSVQDANFSNEFAEFVSLCLDKSPQYRPAASDLLKHHWLRRHPPSSDLSISGLVEGLSLQGKMT